MSTKQLDQFRKHLREHVGEGSAATYVRIVESAQKQFPKDPVAFLLQKHLSSSSRHTYLAALRHWAEFIDDKKAEEQLHSKELRQNFKDSLRVEHQQRDRHAVQPFSPEEEQRIFAVLQKWRRDTELPEWQWPAVSMMFTLGLRAGADVAWLTHRDVDSAIKDGGALTIVTKGSKERDVDARVIMEELTALSEIEQEWDILADLISAGEDSARRVRNAYERIRICIKNLAEAAEIPVKEIHTHRLRHNALQRLYIETNDIVLVKELAGHADIKTTQKYLKMNRTSEAGDHIMAVMKRNFGGKK